MARKTGAEKRESTRVELITAADATFLARGYHAATLDEISDRAGYSTGAVYSNFSGKEGLFLACMDRRNKTQRHAWENVLADYRESTPRIESFGEAVVAILPDAQWSKALLEFKIATRSELGTEALRQADQEWNAIVARVLRIYLGANGLKLPEELVDVARALVALTDGLALHALVNPDLDIAYTVSTTLRLLFAAFRSTGNETAS